MRLTDRPSAPELIVPGHALLDEPGNPDHEEFVEIRRNDREILDAFEERLIRSQSKIEHPALKLEQAQFAICVERGIIETYRLRRNLWR